MTKNKILGKNESMYFFCFIIYKFKNGINMESPHSGTRLSVLMVGSIFTVQCYLPTFTR